MSAVAQPAFAQPTRVYNVLTIHAGAVDYPANPPLDAGIREGLAAPDGRPIDYFTEYLEFYRFPEAETSGAMRDYIRRKYRGRRIDLVIAVTSRGLQFVLEHRATLFPGAAVVAASIGLADDELVRRAGVAVTGVRVGSAFSDTARLALQLHPGTKRIYVIAISPNTANVQSVRAELLPLSRQVPVTFVAAATIPELLAAVRAVPRGSVILYIWYQQPGADYINDPQQPARLVTAASPVPVYGVVDSNVGTGIVGGMVRDTRGTGTRVGLIAQQILKGTVPDDIPIHYAPNLAVFDWRQLQRWGVNMSALPAGADVRFRSPTTWEAYGGYILVASAVMIGQLVLITGLLTQRASRRRAELALRAREAALHASYRRIRRMTGHLINAQETARAEIARDLHDDICQGLVAVSMTVSALRRSVEALHDARTQQMLRQLDRAARDSVESVRRLSHNLHPASLRLVGLAAALNGHCIEIGKQHGVQVTCTAAGSVTDLPADVSVCLFRIAQEALRNGIVHGEARRLAITMTRTDGVVVMTVIDDGRGFDLAAVQRSSSGLGLVSIEERAHVVGGTTQVISSRQRGTTIRVRIPVGAAARPDTDAMPASLPPGPVFGEAMTRVTRAIDTVRREFDRSTTFIASARPARLRAARRRATAPDLLDPPSPTTEPT